MQILYIAGYPRTGSTLFGNMLNEVPGVTHLGEIVHTAAMLRHLNETCGCGKLLADCEFWTTIRSRLDDPDDAPSLYAALQAETGATWLVDSSKTVAQLQLLRERVHPDRLVVLHLLRDPRASIHSRLRSRRAKLDRLGKRQTPATDLIRVARDALEWVREVEVVSGADLELRYEEFAEDPAAALRRVLEAVDLDPGLANRVVGPDHVVELGTNHGMVGNLNRLRTGPVAVVPDLAWKTEMPMIHRRIAWAIAGRSARRHGYAARP